MPGLSTKNVLKSQGLVCLKVILIVILLVGSISVMGCVRVKATPIPPVIEVIEQDGKMCMSLEDAQELGAYLMELEDN